MPFPDTMTCPHCGFEYPIQMTKLHYCKYCGTALTEGTCSVCGKVTDHMSKWQPSLCEDCFKVRNRKYQNDKYARHKTRAQELYDAWIAKIKRIPPTYPRLTEKQWMEVCRYFGGCAMCGKEEVSTRHLWIPAKDGGRYCDWNVVPLCEDCMITLQKQRSRLDPFIRVESTCGSRAIRKESLAATKRIMAYLEEKLNNAASKDSGV